MNGHNSLVINNGLAPELVNSDKASAIHSLPIVIYINQVMYIVYIQEKKSPLFAALPSGYSIPYVHKAKEQ